MNKQLKKKIEETPVCLVRASKDYQPNEDIILAEQEVLSISMSSEISESLQVKGDIILKLRTKPRLIIKLDSESKIFFEALNQNKNLIVNADNFKLHCRVTNLNQKNFGTYKITLSSVDDRIHSTETGEIECVTFDLLNFPMCLGKGVHGRNNPNFLYRSRLNIQDDEWNITIDKIENYKEVHENLKSHDGFGITYVGKIEKSNGEQFHSAELLRIINKVYYFLSFARGANSPVFNLQGYNDKDKIVWKDWTLHRAARWSLTQHNWFCDQHSSEQLNELFPGWSNLFEDELWKKEIPKILYWYFYAGRNTEGAGTDGSLILAIAALELFSFNFLVKHTSLRSKEKYESKHLNNNIYKILEELGIPVVLPEQLKKLYAYSLGKNWQTGPKSIVEIRNEIVHPDRKSSPDSNVCYEALQLALWYIEMAIFRLCNFNGVYANRLIQSKWKGDVEQVPWAIEN